MSPVKPILLALVLCDQIIREVGTNKLSLIGTFNSIFASAFPCVHPTIWVYIAITEGRGRVQCKLRMISLTDNNVIFELPGQMEFGGPTSVGELTIPLQIPFQHPGTFAIEFWADGELLGSRKLNVQQLEQRAP